VLCNFGIEHLDISNMTVGKMDTKTATNIGIKIIIKYYLLLEKKK